MKELSKQVAQHTFVIQQVSKCFHVSISSYSRKTLINCCQGLSNTLSLICRKHRDLWTEIQWVSSRVLTTHWKWRWMENKYNSPTGRIWHSARIPGSQVDSYKPWINMWCVGKNWDVEAHSGLTSEGKSLDKKGLKNRLWISIRLNNYGELVPSAAGILPESILVSIRQ